MIATARLLEDGLFFAGAAAAAAVLTPVAMRVASRVGLVDRPSPHKFHQKETPYLGGLAIVGPVIVAVLVAVFTAPEVVRAQVLAIGLGGAAVAAVGLIDDWATLKPGPRLAVQAMAAVGLWVSGIRVAPVGMLVIDLGLTIVVVIGVTNAVNLLDNMDGLSSGTVAIASLSLFLMAYWQGQHLVPVMALALAGACLGFLPYNFNPARIFLGDAGTLFMGFVLSALAIKLKLEGYPVITRFAVPLFILAVPLFDMTLVVFSRWRAGRPVFRGGTDHSSHRLVASGASVPGAAMITYGATVATGAAAVLVRWAAEPLVTVLALLVSLGFAVALVVWFEAVPSDGTVRRPTSPVGTRSVGELVSAGGPGGLG